MKATSSNLKISPTTTGPFLGLKASKAATASRPADFDLPRVAPANDENQQKVKKNRQNDSENGKLPGVNDLLTGLLNVVGEGLNFATNFVKEENERKKEAAAKKEAEAKLEKEEISAVPALLPGRINNRGPPRFTEIPFEAIPLGTIHKPRGQ